MTVRKKKKAATPDTAATPFFARFLEDQSVDDADAKVTERRGRAPYTTKQVSKTTAAKASKMQTLKYPSDGDEYVLYPYHVEAAKVKVGSTRQTLKYPSDRDEIDPYVPVYLDAADAPKTARSKPKKDAKVTITRPEADLYEAGS